MRDWRITGWRSGRLCSKANVQSQKRARASFFSFFFFKYEPFDKTAAAAAAEPSQQRWFEKSWRIREESFVLKSTRAVLQTAIVQLYKRKKKHYVKVRLGRNMPICIAQTYFSLYTGAIKSDNSNRKAFFILAIQRRSSTTKQPYDGHRFQTLPSVLLTRLPLTGRIMRRKQR